MGVRRLLPKSGISTADCCGTVWTGQQRLSNWPCKSILLVTCVSRFCGISHRLKCMEELILKSMPTYPPRPHGPTTAMFNQFIRPYHENKNVNPFWTHGAEIRRKTPKDGNEIELLHLVVRCLADKPADRPSLDELAHWATWSENRSGYNELDTWFFDVFCSPDNVRKPDSSSIS